MSAERRRLFVAFVLATAALVIALGVGVTSKETAVAGYVLVLAGIMLASFTRLAASPDARKRPSAFDEAIRPRVRTAVRPPELVRVEREITLGIASAGHLHKRLLPMLREAAAARGGTVDEASLPPDDDRNVPGVPFARLRRMVEGIEQL